MKAHQSARPYDRARLVDGIDREDEGLAPLEPGTVRCGCGAVVRRHQRSIVLVRKHRTPQGRWCPQRRVLDESLRLAPDELPPVVWRGGEPSLRSGGAGGYRPSPNGHCHDCGERVSGERLYCGPCLAERMGGR